jgi:hypothetical protein
MNAFAYFPSRPHWTSQQLADAVPRRLHELFAFVAPASAESSDRAARRGDALASYTRRTALPARFLVR